MLIQIAATYGDAAKDRDESIHRFGQLLGLCGAHGLRVQCLRSGVR
jgi:hypothetical protein